MIEKIYLVLVGDKTKKTNNYYYQTLIYANKKFFINYTRKVAAKYNNLYYYCQFHRSTNLSNIFNENNKKKNNICNGKILYKKDLQEYFICRECSTKCLEFGKKIYDNNEDVNYEINNYKTFNEVLV